MRVLVQWSRRTPRDWETIDSREWVHSPKKPCPPPRDLVDGPGWVHALNIQGVVFSGDHYAIEHVSDTEIRVFCWRNDPNDYPEGEIHGHIWTFRTLARDPKNGGAWNSRITKGVYAQPEAFARYKYFGWVPGETLFPWEDFTPPAEEVTRHGVKVAGQHHRRHKDKQSRHGWREWTEGVPASELVNGRIPVQRPLGRYNRPKGTETYYHNGTDLANGVYKAENENELGTSAAGYANESVSISKNSQVLAFCATTPENEPGSGAWPTGEYRYNIDCETCDPDVTYGLLTIGNKDGGFARVNGNLDSQLEIKTQTDNPYSAPGTNTASTGSVSWSTGNDTDRFVVVVAAGNAHNKDSESFALDLGESDDWADGPWTAPSGAPTGHFMGFNW